MEDEDWHQAFVKVARVRDASIVGNLVSENQPGLQGLLDLPTCLSAEKLPDGSYAAIMEDDLKSKLILYHWKP